MKNAHKVSEILQAAGYKAYVVGGAVRDTIMGQVPKDWDLATDATPQQVIALFRHGAGLCPEKIAALFTTKEQHYTVIPTGIQYGTVTVMMEDYTDADTLEVVMEPLEITTFRADQTYSDGRRPDAVTYSKTIEEDLARRDFTCNAIAWDIVSGEFVDPYTGRRDIVDKVIVCVGKPLERFQEDGLRIMRALRFSATKGFELSPNTRRAIHTSGYMLGKVSKERIRDEFLKILGSDNPRVSIQWMKSLGMLRYICPELERQVGAKQNKYHAFDVWDHTLACLHHCESGDPITRLAVLLHDIAKPATSNPHPKRPGENQFLRHEEVGADMAEAWMREYKFSNDEIERVKHIILHHLIMYDTKWSNAAVRRWVQRVGKENIADLICMARADLLGKGLDVTGPLNGLAELTGRILMMKDPIVTKSSELAISGNDVMSIMGITKGNAEVGKMLNYLLDLVTECPARNTREALLDEVRMEWGN